MEGFQITLFFQENKRHKHQPLADWIVGEAKRLGIGGATVVHAAEGYGRGGRLHCARFFELAEQPVEVTLAVSPDEMERLFASLRAEKVEVFYVKVPIEYGMLSSAATP
ncbi:hypothetical protein PATSB16_42120 [Pandoraea thiooxydans]|uniref:Uncharacterized protein n=1 Tax=Pandoraea thiooxydans TaxID=445709 RepID=A0A0G3EWK3_9BURK|nr:DUF190 domain-containing protein [Pandoraea thiooxydans]AKJ69787.1 hypothetical protein ABW99_17830 [Pandoraea thiooxydans]APR97546.1 hypothetical protein PATSB16_42120 [Pandoraea thiooxydans]